MIKSGTGSGMPATHALKPHALGVAAIVFFVVASAAPLAASVATAPVVFAALGITAPLAYLVVGVVLLLFSVAYAAMSKHVAHASGLAAYVDRGLGRRAGMAGAFVAVLSYSAVLCGIFGGFGYFASYVVGAKLHVDVPWYWWSLACVVLVAVLGYLRIELSAKVLGVFLVLEVGILLAFDVVATARGGAAGVTLAGFDPASLPPDALGIGLLFAAVAFIGFEATAIYAEEARRPDRTIPRATFAAVLLISLFYMVTTWVLGNAYGLDNVAAAAQNNAAGFVVDAIGTYAGAVVADLANVLVITSYFAAVLALHNTLSRYLFALGRVGALPRMIGRTHPRWRSPHAASVVGTVMTVVVVGLFAAAGADPFLQLFGWLTGLGTIGIFTLQALASLSVLVFFRRTRLPGSAWTTVVCPLLALIGIGAIVYLALQNWALLSGATSGVAEQLPWLVVVAALAGVLVVGLGRDRVGRLAASTPVPDAADADAPPPTLSDI